MDELLVVQGLRKGYPQGDRWLSVLDEVSISVAAGEIVAVVGPRGEGKTTLLKVVAGLEPADAGEVRLHGRLLTGISDGKRAALLRQEISWLDRRGPGLPLTVRDYVALPLVTRPAARSAAAGRGKSRVMSLCGRHAGGRGEARRRALYELDRVGAGGCATRRWGELSAWEQTRVMLARASLCSPRMLVVDDLLAGADMQGIQEAGDQLRALVQKRGFGVLMSVSDLERALIADRVWRFDGGRLRLVSDQTGAGEADVIDFPGEGSQRRRLRGTGA